MLDLPPGGMAPWLLVFFPAASVENPAMIPDLFVACWAFAWFWVTKRSSTPVDPSARLMEVLPPGSCPEYFTEVWALPASASVAQGDCETCCCLGLCWVEPELPSSPKEIEEFPPGSCPEYFTEVTGFFCSSSVAQGDWDACCCCLGFCWAGSSHPRLKLL